MNVEINKKRLISIGVILSIIIIIVAIFFGYRSSTNEIGTDNLGSNEVRESITAAREINTNVIEQLGETRRAFQDIDESNKRLENKLVELNERQSAVSDNLSEAKRATGAAQSAIESNEVSIRAAEDSVRSSEETINSLADSYRALDQLQRSSDAEFQRARDNTVAAERTADELKSSINESRRVLQQLKRTTD